MELEDLETGGLLDAAKKVGDGAAGEKKEDEPKKEAP